MHCRRIRPSLYYAANLRAAALSALKSTKVQLTFAYNKFHVSATAGCRCRHCYCCFRLFPHVLRPSGSRSWEMTNLSLCSAVVIIMIVIMIVYSVIRKVFPLRATCRGLCPGLDSAVRSCCPVQLIVIVVQRTFPHFQFRARLFASCCSSVGGGFGIAVGSGILVGCFGYFFSLLLFFIAHCFRWGSFSCLMKKHLPKLSRCHFKGGNGDRTMTGACANPFSYCE